MSPARRPNVPNDPLLRLLPSELPRSFTMLPAKEQAWRGRVFLMVWAIGGTEAFSWANALNDDPVHVADLQETVRLTPDERIRFEVAARQAEDRRAERLGVRQV
jgi:hypothetical protein